MFYILHRILIDPCPKVCYEYLQVAKMFDKLLEEISNQVGGLSSQNTEVRTLLRNILQVRHQLLLAEVFGLLFYTGL